MKPQTKICKICFKDIKTNNIFTFFDKNLLFCKECLDKLTPIFKFFFIDSVKCLALYEYDENVQGLLYQIKGCYDIELAPIFLYKYRIELSIYFSGYTIVPIPSWKDDDNIRGFNHVEAIFEPLKLKMIKCLFKTQKYKQSDQSKNNRTGIANILKMSQIDNTNKLKILLVDDVHTTGNTLKAAIKLLKDHGVKKIRVLVIAKTKDISA